MNVDGPFRNIQWLLNIQSQSDPHITTKSFLVGSGSKSILVHIQSFFMPNEPDSI